VNLPHASTSARKRLGAALYARHPIPFIRGAENPASGWPCDRLSSASTGPGFVGCAGQIPRAAARGRRTAISRGDVPDGRRRFREEVRCPRAMAVVRKREKLTHLPPPTGTKAARNASSRAPWVEVGPLPCSIRARRTARTPVDVISAARTILIVEIFFACAAATPNCTPGWPSGFDPDLSAPGPGARLSQIATEKKAHAHGKTRSRPLRRARPPKNRSGLLGAQAAIGYRRCAIDPPPGGPQQIKGPMGGPGRFLELRQGRHALIEGHAARGKAQRQACRSARRLKNLAGPRGKGGLPDFF